MYAGLEKTKKILSFTKFTAYAAVKKFLNKKEENSSFR